MNRRELLKAAAMSAAALPFSNLAATFAQKTITHPDPWKGLKIGVATYTFREWPITKTSRYWSGKRFI